MKEGKKGDKKDNIEREFRIGMQLNKHCVYNPNLVKTIDLIDKKGTKTLVVERIPGRTLGEDEKLSVLLDTIIQLSACLEDLSPIGFTHYNIHRGNIMLLPNETGNPIDLHYPRLGLSIKVMHQIKLIDFGRSYTFLHGGHEVEKRRVFNSYHPLHDLLYFIFSSFHHGKYDEEGRKISNFYGFKAKRIGSYSTGSWLSSIPSLSERVPSTKRLAKFLTKI